MADFGVGEAAAAEGAKGAGEAAAADAAIGAAATDIGTAAAADALATTAGAAAFDLGTAGAIGAEAGTAAAGLGTAGAAASDLSAGAAAADLGSVGATATAADVGATGVAGAAIPEVTVMAPATAGAGLGAAGAVAPAIAGGALGAATGGGGGGAAQTDQATGRVSAQDATAGAAGDGPQGFLPATGTTDVGSLTPDFASALGIDAGASPTPLMAGTFDPSSLAVGMQDVALPTTGIGEEAVGSSGLMDWLSNPKNLMTLGKLGVQGYSQLARPKLPGAAQTSLNAAGPAVQQAQSIIQSGGTATPIWSQQKASIDASIEQQIQQASAALQQNAANAGEGNQNSGVVQQQLAQLRSTLETQRQQLYMQAQQQNVNNAVSELTGANNVLSSIAQIQLAQEKDAQAQAAQLASLLTELEQLNFG